MITHYLYVLKMKVVKEVNEVNVVAVSPPGNQLMAEVTTHSY